MVGNNLPGYDPPNVTHLGFTKLYLAFICWMNSARSASACSVVQYTNASVVMVLSVFLVVYDQCDRKVAILFPLMSLTCSVALDVAELFKNYSEFSQHHFFFSRKSALCDFANHYVQEICRLLVWGVQHPTPIIFGGDLLESVWSKWRAVLREIPTYNVLKGFFGWSEHLVVIGIALRTASYLLSFAVPFILSPDVFDMEYCTNEYKPYDGYNKSSFPSLL